MKQRPPIGLPNGPLTGCVLLKAGKRAAGLRDGSRAHANRRQMAGVWRAVLVVWLIVLLMGVVPGATWASSCCPAVLDRGAGHSPDAGAALRDTVSTTARAVATFKMSAVLPTGSLGLPGEPIVWVMSVNNDSEATLVDVIVSDVLREELQIDSVEVDRGEAAVSEQMVVVTVPALAPGEGVIVTLFTTVRRSPSNGVLVNQALLSATGPTGALSLTATAEVFIPTGLPPTGYPPAGDLPGKGEPSLGLLAALAITSVLLTAWIVYRRGRRW